MMTRRPRRTPRDMDRMRQAIIALVREHGRVQLPNLIKKHWEALGVDPNSDSDKALVRKQLDSLPGVIAGREGVPVVLRWKGLKKPVRSEPPKEAAPVAPPPPPTAEPPLSIEDLCRYADMLTYWADTLHAMIYQTAAMLKTSRKEGADEGQGAAPSPDAEGGE